MRAWLMGMLLAVAAPAAWAQAGPGPERLREQVMARFMENVRSQAGLSDEQFAQLQTVVRGSMETRRTLQERERTTMRAMEGQMRPGVAADPDSVSKLLDALIQVQADRLDLTRREQQQFATFLNPVQRAQVVLAFVRLERQIEQVMQGRRMDGPRRF